MYDKIHLGTVPSSGSSQSSLFFRAASHRLAFEPSSGRLLSSTLPFYSYRNVNAKNNCFLFEHLTAGRRKSSDSNDRVRQRPFPVINNRRYSSRSTGPLAVNFWTPVALAAVPRSEDIMSKNGTAEKKKKQGGGEKGTPSKGSKAKGDDSSASSSNTLTRERADIVRAVLRRKEEEVKTMLAPEKNMSGEAGKLQCLQILAFFAYFTVLLLYYSV